MLYMYVHPFYQQLEIIKKCHYLYKSRTLGSLVFWSPNNFKIPLSTVRRTVFKRRAGKTAATPYRSNNPSKFSSRVDHLLLGYVRNKPKSFISRHIKCSHLSKSLSRVEIGSCDRTSKSTFEGLKKKMKSRCCNRKVKVQTSALMRWSGGIFSELCINDGLQTSSVGQNVSGMMQEKHKLLQRRFTSRYCCYR